MSECEQSRLCGAYHDGEMPAGDRAKFELHLGQCSQCRGELSSLRGLSSLLAREPKPVMPPQVARRMHQAVESFFSVRVIHFAEVVSAIAAAILITCMLGMFGRSAPEQIAPPTVQAVVLDETMLTPPTEPIANAIPSYEEKICQLMVQDLSGDQGQ